MTHSLLEYQYRDGGNFKTRRVVAFDGAITTDQIGQVVKALESREFFIAEQIDLPPLYESLYAWSRGHRTRQDHCWHEFVSIQPVTGRAPRQIASLGPINSFVRKVGSIKEWDESLSPHFKA